MPFAADVGEAAATTRELVGTCGRRELQLFGLRAAQMFLRSCQIHLWSREFELLPGPLVVGILHVIVHFHSL